MNKTEFDIFERILQTEGGFGSFYDFKACLEQAFKTLCPVIKPEIFKLPIGKQLDYLFKLIAKIKKVEFE